MNDRPRLISSASKKTADQHAGKSEGTFFHSDVKHHGVTLARIYRKVWNHRDIDDSFWLHTEWVIVNANTLEEVTFGTQVKPLNEKARMVMLDAALEMESDGRD